MYFLFRIFVFLANLRLLSKVWFVFYYLDFFRKPIVFKNLDIAFPEKSKEEKVKIAKNTYKNFLTFFEDNVNEDFNVSLKNEDVFKKALESKKPIILLTAHFGNWEIPGRFLTEKFDVKMAVVMREFDNEKIREFFKKLRKGNRDIKLINKRKSAKEILKALIREKRVLGILIDQYTRNKQAPVVKFFKPTRFNPAVSKLAKTTKAIVVPLFCYKQNGEYIIEFLPSKSFEGSIEEFTQWQATTIENMIRLYPDEYYWFHDRWKE